MKKSSMVVTVLVIAVALVVAGVLFMRQSPTPPTPPTAGPTPPPTAPSAGKEIVLGLQCDRTGYDPWGAEMNEEPRRLRIEEVPPSQMPEVLRLATELYAREQTRIAEAEQEDAASERELLPDQSKPAHARQANRSGQRR